MPDDYDFSIPIKKGLKFKGDKSKIGKKKRKQKQKKLKLEQKELETEIEHKHVHEGSSHESENENTNTNINEGLMDKIPLEKDSPNDSDDDLGKTEAEKKFETIRRKRVSNIYLYVYYQY